MVVTIDGPAASGKSSVSRELSRRLGWPWVSTGAFYRGLAYVALQEKSDLSNEQIVGELADSRTWQVELKPENTLVLYRGRDVTDEIMREKVGSAASVVSQLPLVRKKLLPLQRNCAKGVGLIAEGRDCGTVVFPDAIAKIFLTASSEDRAGRRALQAGDDVKKVLDAQKQRDARDQGRSVAPLQVPPGSHVVDTSGLNLDQVVDSVEKIVRKAMSRG